MTNDPMNLTIAIADLAAARKLLTRIRFERLKLPVLNHVLATVDAAGLSLAATDLDHWLETRLPAVIDPFAPARFLASRMTASASVGDTSEPSLRIDLMKSATSFTSCSVISLVAFTL